MEKYCHILLIAVIDKPFPEKHAIAQSLLRTHGNALKQAIYHMPKITNI